MKLPPILTEPLAAKVPEFLAECHHRHGPVFALETQTGPPTVYCIGPAAVREMFAREREGQLAVHNTEAVHTLFRRAVFTLSGRDHEEVRTYLAAGLRHDAVTVYLPTVAEIAHRHVTRWVAASTVPLYQAARDFTMEVCLSAILGLANNDPTMLRVPELFDRFVAGTELPPNRTDDTVYIAALDAAVELRTLLHVRTACLPDSTGASVTAKLHSAGRAPGGDVVDHLLALLIAARETTASLITWLLIECALDEQLATTLATDATDLVSDPSRANDRSSAPGLRRALTECTRLHTPNTVATRTAITDVRLGGYDAPAGCHVAYSAPATHLLPELFTDPESFHPERFLGQAGARQAAALLAFGRGAHSCLGRGFAEATTLLLAAAVLAEHRLNLDTGLPEVARFQPVRVPAGSVHARVRRRAHG